MPRSMASPTAPATRKASGSAMASDQSNRPGAEVRMTLLHDEGGVGAEHHHLAMRHVDDAHDAEGDGEADRGEQQHRAERDAVPDVLRRRPRAPATLLMRAIAAGRGVLQRALRLRLEARSAATARRGRRARAISVDRGELVGLGQVGLEHGRRRAPAPARLDARRRSPRRSRRRARSMAAGSGV